MLTPDTYEGMPRSRLHLEVTPNHTPTSPAKSQNTPGKSTTCLHFNSQQYRTPSTRQAHFHLKHLRSPQCGTPPRIHIPGTMDAPHSTPRSTPRFQQLRRTPNSGSSLGSRSCRTPGMTPTEIIRNPFERDPEAMAGWVFSPGVFATKATSDGKISPFWSIDHIAMMKPADIDENSAKLVGSVDSEVEERAQKAIEEFFNKNDVIVPSPWSENGDKKRIQFLPQTPVTPGIVPMTTEHENSPCPSIKSGTKESKYYTQETAKEETSPEVLSTSSLRRKLFFNGEVESPHSSADDRERPHSLPMESEPSPTADTMCNTPNTKRRSHPTPPSNLFSSSPIRSDSDREPQTPSLRRCSTAPDLMTSPELSPIGRSNQNSNQRPRSIKEPSPLSDNTPLCHPLQATPSSGRPSLPFSSPGVSPIRLEASAIEDKSPDFHCGSWEHRRTKHLQVKIPAPPEISADDSAISMKTCEETKVKFLKDMEVDQELSFNQDPFAASDGFRVVRGFNEFSESVVDQDPSQHPAHSMYTTHSQDTGYQTNSLQSTNHDTGLHTNLTNQFGSLLPVSSRDTGLEEDINESASMDFNQVDPLSLFSSTRIPLSNQDDEMTRDVDFSLPLTQTESRKTSSGFSMVLDESLVRRQARKALGQLDANQMGNASTKDCPWKIGTSIQSDEHNCVTSKVVSQWKATVPTPLRRQLRHAGLIGDTTVEEQDLLPSAVASKALQRAGADLDRYCGEPIRTSSKPKSNIVFKEILTSDITDFHEEELFKCS